MYKPLHKDIAIGPSRLHGLGILTKVEIEKDTNLGATHFPNNDQLHGYIRTPTGGFLNHSNTPNCRKEEDGSGILYLITNQDIKAGEELTIKYTLYDIPEGD